MEIQDNKAKIKDIFSTMLMPTLLLIIGFLIVDKLDSIDTRLSNMELLKETVVEMKIKQSIMEAKIQYLETQKK